MPPFSQHSERLAPVLEHAIREQRRCEHLQDLWASVDSEAADACQFDAGSLAACQRILHAMLWGADVLAAIAALIDLIADLNDERSKYASNE
jgi:hypothetical protein